jgi:molybdenum cofactor synthesis domain-containing protein
MIKFGIITVSDGVFAGQREDLSGPALGTLVTSQGWIAQKTIVVPDEKDYIQKAIKDFAFDSEIDVILTTGGTGFTLRDVTPEATKEIIEKEAAPIANIMLIESFRQNPKSVLSRGTVGILNQRLIMNLPGSPKGAVENLGVILHILPHAVELLQGMSTSH